MSDKPPIPWYFTDLFLGLVALAVGVFCGWWGQNRWPMAVSLTLCLVLVILGFALLLRQRERHQRPAMKPALPEPEEFSDEVIQAAERFAQLTEMTCIQLKPVRRPTSVFDSKFGGTPYLPPGFQYPVNENPAGRHQPLKLLAQLNFATLPHVDWWPQQRFPDAGILQFYITNQEDDDMFGADFDDPTNQKAFRVVYHANVIDDVAQLQAPPAIPGDSEGYFPFEGEFGLDATVAKMPITPQDFRFEAMFKDLFKNAIPADRLDQLADKVLEYREENSESAGHRIGGYPYFTQEDPRGSQFTQMLLQIDSDMSGSADEIIWGDVGVANFFVPGPVDSSAPFDVSTVMYTWDCS